MSLGITRDQLIEKAIRMENVSTHERERGDLVVFDAVGSLHRRASFDRSQSRSIHQLSTLVPR